MQGCFTAKVTLQDWRPWWWVITGSYSRTDTQRTPQLEPTGTVGVAWAPGLSVRTLESRGYSWTPWGQPPALDSALFPWVQSKVALSLGFSGSNKVSTVLKDKHTTVFWLCTFLSETPCGTRDPPYKGEIGWLWENPENLRVHIILLRSSEIMWKCFQDHLLSRLHAHIHTNTRAHTRVWAHTHTHTHTHTHPWIVDLQHIMEGSLLEFPLTWSGFLASASKEN